MENLFAWDARFRSRFDKLLPYHPSRVATASTSTNPLAALPRALLREVSRELNGVVKGEVLFNAEGRALWATDSSNYRQVPIGVVLPRDDDDVVQAVGVAKKYGLALLSRGGGTSLAGQTTNAALVLDFSKYMTQILAMDPMRQRARVQPGLILDHLRAAAAPFQLTFGPDPATHNRNTFGGMIGNNSCGVHSVTAGRTSENVLAMEVLTYDGLRLRVGETSEAELERLISAGGRRGEIYAGLKRLRDQYGSLFRKAYPPIPRRVSGYGLDELLPENGFNVARALVGTEGTCVVVLNADIRLIYSPPKRALLVIGYEDVYQAGDEVPFVMAHKPLACEGMDDLLFRHSKTKRAYGEGTRYFPPGRGWLIIEYGGETREEAEAKCLALKAAYERRANIGATARLVSDPGEQEAVWKVRESGLATTAVPGGGRPQTWPGFEDSAVAPKRFGDYLRALRKLFDRYGYSGSFYGHFGQGLVHVRVDFDLVTARGIETFHAFMEEAADLVVSFGGSLSGEHGDGQARAALLPKMFPPEMLQAFAEFKRLWDPDGRMNPGKVLNAHDFTQDLRLGTGYDPPVVKTHFRFANDGHDFAKATLRCVGVGLCRRTENGTMCPSYMVTRDERHTTRGRAHALFEMMQGDVIQDGWKSESVRDALNLCLACKGCKAECPVNVDMATYKAEFLSHYYKGRLRPRAAYAMGLIQTWARLAARAPHLANSATQTPLLAAAFKGLAGIDQRRKIPAFATLTFKDWFFQRASPLRGQKQVLLWPDTFTNFFQPQVGKAAVEILENAGFEVIIPYAHLCCGRPLYDYGMLDRAKAHLRVIMNTLKPHLEAGTPIVGLEPSCVAVFRDELKDLFAGECAAERLTNQVFLFSEFLMEQVGDFRLPRLERKALVHGHCHHKSVIGLEAEEKLLETLGMTFEILDDGCCGMAGSFGFEPDKYDVSLRCGERVLLPKVRQAAEDDLIISNGFSCMEQIAQSTDRRALHLAEAIHMALKYGPRGLEGPFPEREYLKREQLKALRPTALELAVSAGGVALVAGGLYAARKRLKRH